MCSRESARNREIKRKRGRERKKDTGTKALMEQSVLINKAWAYILSYKVVILSKDKNSRLTKHKAISIKERRGYLSP